MEDKVTKGARPRKAATTKAAPARDVLAKAEAVPSAKVPATAPKTPARPKAAPPKAAAPRKAAAEPPAATVTVRPESPDRGELVRLAAYFRAERRGFAPGHELEDWIAAEAEVAATLVSPAAPRKVPAGKPRGT
jgi:hypothetical protein